MLSEQDKNTQMILQSFHDVLVSLSGIAWVLLSFLFLITLGLLALFFRWIRRGGLRPRSTTEFFRRQKMAEQFYQNKMDRV